MKLATIHDGSPDGALLVISDDGARYLRAPIATLQTALEQWADVHSTLRILMDRLAAGGGETTANLRFAAPLPRAWQWLDGSAFESHGQLMEKAFGIASIETDLPLMYQGMSHTFYGPNDDVPFPSEADGIDFEGEFGVITGPVPMGTSANTALDHIHLIVQINDWSLRAIAPIEMKTGFGWIGAKPACSVAPFAVTPDELGGAWRNGRVCLDLAVDWNGARFGNANGAPMAFGFHELIAHAARTRALPAGTIIGSGTVSNANYRDVGSSCIAERRAIELTDTGSPVTRFMHFGDTVRMEARTADGEILFGAIEQRVVSN